MHQPPNTLARVRRLLDEIVRPNVLARRETFSVASTMERREPMPLLDARAAPVHEIALGEPWGRPWHGRWFRLRATVPAGWDGATVVAHIDLGFGAAQPGFQAEGMAWRDGRILHAVQPDRRLVRLDDAHPGTEVELWLEAVAYPFVFSPASG